MTLDELIDKLQKIRDLNPTDVNIESEISWIPCGVDDNDAIHIELEIEYKLPHYKWRATNE